MKKIVLSLTTCALMACSASAMAGVGVYLKFQENPAYDLVDIDKLRVDQYEQHPAGNYNAARIQGRWQPSDVHGAQLHYDETKSENSYYHKFFVISVSGQNQPVCFVDVSGTVQYSGLAPRINGLGYGIQTTAFGASKNINCSGVLKKIVSGFGAFGGDTLELHLNVGYPLHAVPKEVVNHPHQNHLAWGQGDFSGVGEGFAPWASPFYYDAICSDQTQHRFYMDNNPISGKYFAQHLGTGLHYHLPGVRSGQSLNTKAHHVSVDAAPLVCRQEGGSSTR